MISKKTKYGLQALVTLAKRYEEQKPLLISEISEANRIPKKFLELILLELKNNGILSSRKGKGGGYLLAKHPDLIPVGSVVRVLEGALAPVPCVSHTAYQKCDECINESECEIRLIMKEVRDATAAILDGTSLEDLILKGRNQSFSYQI